MRIIDKQSGRVLNSVPQEPTGVDEVLFRTSIRYPSDGPFKRIPEYKDSPESDKIRKFIRNSTIVKVVPNNRFLHGKIFGELTSDCVPKAIYLMAVNGTSIFNPVPDLIKDYSSATIVGVGNDLDLSKCYAINEFSPFTDTCIKKYNCAPFIYAVDSVECMLLGEYKSRSGVIQLNYGPIDGDTRFRRFDVMSYLGMPFDLIRRFDTNGVFNKIKIIESKVDINKIRSKFRELSDVLSILDFTLGIMDMDNHNYAEYEFDIRFNSKSEFDKLSKLNLNSKLKGWSVVIEPWEHTYAGCLKLSFRV